MGGARRIVLLLLGLQLGLGVIWTVANFGIAPHYGDSLQYLNLSGTLEGNRYRGIAYPLVLRGIDALIGASDDLARFRFNLVEGQRLDAPDPPEFRLLQLLQLAALAGSLAYFLSAFVAGPAWGRALGARARPALLLVLAAVFLDPLLLHFALSVMTDSFTLSACLVFVAALVDLRRGERPAWLCIGLLALSQALAASLRGEKNAVLLVAGVATAGVWWLSARGMVPAAARALRRRAGVTGAVVLAVAGAVVAVQAGTEREAGWWPVRSYVLHHRVIFPHLASVYDDLSAETRSLLPRQAALFYDRNMQNPRVVIGRIAGEDAALRDRLTGAMARAVLARKAPAIAWDVVTDTVEGLFATVSFYARLGSWLARGSPVESLTVRFETAPHVYFNLKDHRPGVSRPFVLLGAIGSAVAACLAFAGCWRTARMLGLRDAATRLLGAPAAVPAGLLLAFNALAFSLTADLVYIRYALFSHALFLIGIYALTVRWALGGGPAGVESAP